MRLKLKTLLFFCLLAPITIFQEQALALTKREQKAASLNLAKIQNSISGLSKLKSKIKNYIRKEQSKAHKNKLEKIHHKLSVLVNITQRAHQDLKEKLEKNELKEVSITKETHLLIQEGVYSLMDTTKKYKKRTHWISEKNYPKTLNVLEDFHSYLKDNLPSSQGPNTDTEK